MARNLISFDWAMKRLLRSKANYKVLEGFLSELLKRNVKIEEILESESNREAANDKYNIVDILVRLDGEELVIIEVQADAQFDYFHRMLYGVSKIITDHMDLGAKYHEVKKVYSVSIVYFDLGNGTDYVYHCKSDFIGLNDQSKFNLNEKQKQLYQKEYIYDIHPEYYIIKVNQFNNLAKNTLDEWIYFLKNEEIKDDFKAKGLAEAKETLSILKLSEPERRDYEGYVKNHRYRESMVDGHYRSGKLDGLAEGKAEGKIEAKKESVLNMHRKHVSVENIAEFISLSVAEVEAIIAKN